MSQVDGLVRNLAEVLEGSGPMLQGAALADAVAMYFAGHHPLVRADAMEEWTKIMRSLIEINEAALIDALGRKPEGWEPS